MRTCLRASLAILLFLPILMGAPAASATQTTGTELIDEIDAFAEEYVENQGLAGISIAVVRDGQAVHTQGYGHDSAGNAVTAATPMRTASLSKSITAMAIMRLVEDGEVALDSPIGDHLPEFDPVDPRASGITVRQLLDQTSGMSGEGLTPPHRRAKETLEEAVETVEETELVTEPGTKHEYFNGNYWLLAHLVEVVTDKPFDVYLDEEVFGPLGMDHSTLAIINEHAVAEVDGLVDGHVSLYGMPVSRSEPLDFFVGAGGIVSTAEDMARWLAPYTDEGRTPEGTEFVHPTVIDTMLTPSDPEGRYGFGWRPLEEEDRWFHSGVAYGYTAYQTIAEGRTLGVVVLNNNLTSYDTSQPLAMAILDILEGNDAEQPTPVHRIIDYVLAALTVLTVVLGVRRLWRADDWAERLHTRSTGRLAARLAPRLAPLLLILGFAAVGVASGADASVVLAIGAGALWPPALTIWVLVAAAFNVTTVGLRVHRVRRARSRRESSVHQA